MSLHGDIPKNVRMQNFQRFCKQEINIMISTDLGSRGLDFPFLNHVINFDFPKTTSDYLHRFLLLFIFYRNNFFKGLEEQAGQEKLVL